MANGRNSIGKKDTGRDSGGFVALPWSVLDCPAYASLSGSARSLLLEFARQFVRDNNGRLLATRAHLSKRGWTSSDVVHRAKNELITAGFIFETVKGHRPNKASWYALTWRTLDRLPGYDFGATESFERSAYSKAQPPLKNASVKPSKRIQAAKIVPFIGVSDVASSLQDGTISTTFHAGSTPDYGHHLENHLH
jgi:hypothetical protein